MDDEKKISHAVQKVLHFLSFRSRTRSEIVTYLNDKGVEEEIAIKVLEKITSMDLIDDHDFARQLIEARIRKYYGPKKIFSDLLSKGVERETAKQALFGIDQQQWVESMEAYLKKERISQEALDDRNARMRVEKKLYSRGFNPSDIRKTIDSIRDKE